MKPTIAYLQDKFNFFNDSIFNGRLPQVPIELSDASSFLGKCVFLQLPNPDGTMRCFNFRLRFSTRIDLPEKVLEDVLIHEMIHYMIHWMGMHDTSAHGKIFKAMMQTINAAHGRNITISHPITAEQREQSISTKATWHIIAVVHFKDRKTGIKVLPRVASKVIAYSRGALASGTVKRVDLYLHNNPFFNRYPVSAALRVHDIDSRILAENLTGARPIGIKGSELYEIRP